MLLLYEIKVLHIILFCLFIKSKHRLLQSFYFRKILSLTLRYKLVNSFCFRVTIKIFLLLNFEQFFSDLKCYYFKAG